MPNSTKEDNRTDYTVLEVRDYPHQLSGGMKQRVVDATDISCDPLVLIADEPTTSLNAAIQA